MHEKIRSDFIDSSDKSGFWIETCAEQDNGFV